MGAAVSPGGIAHWEGVSAQKKLDQWQASQAELKDVQNIDLMILAGFCRNCLSKWYKASADDQGVSLDLDEARQAVYGMTYDEWKNTYQTEATPEQLAAMQKANS